jgi:hypothetical protein
MLRKLAVVVVIIFIVSSASRAQDTINPYNTGQPMTIILQNMDVNYPPLAPDTTDWSGSLSNQAVRLLDSNGAGNWGVYLPKVHDTELYKWNPYGTGPLGLTAHWQRYFTAMRKSDGTHTDIIAGSHVTDSIAHGPVIISRNEDVDFRASGTIKLENGFHVMPGARFHAYTEPRWGKLLLCDDFDSSAINSAKWLVANNASVFGYGIGPNCAYDSNLTLVSDPDAHDGKALDIALRMHIDSCTCYARGDVFDSCGQLPLDTSGHGTSRYSFSTGLLRSCPFPYTYRGNPMGPLVSDHAPYGRYEIRVKIPHIPIHMNAMWCWDNNFEFDHEMFGNQDVDSGWYHTTIYRNQLYGPFKGVFQLGSDTEFRSNGPDWRHGANNPNTLVVDNFPYQVNLLGDTSHSAVVADTTEQRYKGWPTSLLAHTGSDSLTFYYARIETKYSDSLTWHAYQDSSHKWRILDAPYRDSAGQLLRFSKNFQPQWITLKTSNIPRVSKTLNCFWDSSLNTPVDKGLLYLYDDSLLSTDLDSNTQIDTFFTDEGMHNYYSYPPIQIDTPQDSASYYNPVSYVYHTFALELLPNEARFLLDGSVVARYPDRMIPTGDKRANWITTLPRFAPTLTIGQMTLDGLDSAHIQKVIDHINDCPGCWPVTVNGISYPAAHMLVDYVRVYDIPDNVKVSGFPH